MTRVLVYEFTCAAPTASRDAAGAVRLAAEGAAMLDAVLADFRRVRGVEARTIRREPDEPAAFRAAARRADWSLVIAPEFNRILQTRCQWVLEEGGRLLGPSPDAVALCADKLALAAHWQRRDVPTPPTFIAEELSAPPAATWVVKPRFGAGSQDTTLNGPLRSRGEAGPMIVQPFVAGRAASVAFLCGPLAQYALPPAEQLLSDDGRFHYLGGRLPLSDDLSSRASAVARQALATVPGVCGYVGVDVILGEDGRDWAIEINPRLTTSYIGLRAFAKVNLAEAMLRTAEGASPALAWRDRPIQFTADGRVSP